MGQRPSATDTVRPVPPRTLNPRDLDLLRLLADGRSTGQIAVALSVTTNTARTRIRRVQAKLDVRDRSAAVQVASDRGVLGIPGPRRPVV
jgi:DNA-binding CsgD family transcriptional regulator